MLYSIEKYLLWDFSYQEVGEIIIVNKIPVFLIILFLGIQIVTMKKINLLENISNLDIKYWILVLIGIILPILLLYDLNPHDFIYFRF